MAVAVNPDLVFKALADPTRREILSLLRKQSSTVGDIAGNFRMSRPAVSKHLRQLREAGLVFDRPAGTSRICELNAAPLRTIDAYLAGYRTLWKRNLSRLKIHLEEKDRVR